MSDKELTYLLKKQQQRKFVGFQISSNNLILLTQALSSS